jgi:glyoxylase-like metal-dependent hydrolase (beta-lactamase superfamily II)
MSVMLHSWPELFRTEYIAVYKVSTDFYIFLCLQDAIATFYLVIGLTRALLIDGGGTVRDVIPAVRRITDLPVDFVLTHGHWDHTGAMFEFDHLYMHAGDKSLIPHYQGQIIEISHGYAFDLGGLTLETVDMIGHTPGSVGFLDAKNKRLFTGDAIGSQCCWMQLTRLPLESLRDVLRLVEQMGDRWDEIWAGHYNELDRPLKLDYVLKMKELIEDLVTGGGKFVGQPDEGMKKSFHLSFTPLLAANGDVSVYYDPGKLHYL